VRKNNFSNGAGAITDRTLEKQAFLIIPEGVAEVIFAHRLRGTRSHAGALENKGFFNCIQIISQDYNLVYRGSRNSIAG